MSIEEALKNNPGLRLMNTGDNRWMVWDGRWEVYGSSSYRRRAGLLLCTESLQAALGMLLPGEKGDEDDQAS